MLKRSRSVPVAFVRHYLPLVLGDIKCFKNRDFNEYNQNGEDGEGVGHVWEVKLFYRLFLSA